MPSPKQIAEASPGIPWWGSRGLCFKAQTSAGLQALIPNLVCQNTSGGLCAKTDHC